MATIAATNSATQSVQSLLLQSRIEQARREADQAESRAHDLRAQADDEQRKADQGNNRAQQLTAEQQRLGTVRKRPTDSTYSAPVRAPNPETPAHVESPQALQTMAIARSVGSLSGSALFAAYGASAGAGRVLSVTA
ncbi:MAG: hypothetical protein U1E84_11530 [Rhodoferax sp.]